MKKYFIILLSALFILSACGKQKQNNEADESVPAIVEAKLDVPEKAKPGEKISINVNVTQNGKPVDDANEVQFEIWKENEKESSKTVDSTHMNDGNYSIDYTFKDEGLYYVQSHVTARSMHTMPKKSIQVGALTKEHEHHHGEEAHHQEEEAHHHHGHGDVSIHFMKPDHIHMNEKVKMTVHIEKEEESITNAQVRFEIAKKGEKTPSWVDVKAMKNGEFTGEVTFPTKGDYSIKIHVENKEGLHEHTVETVTVQ